MVDQEGGRGAESRVAPSKLRGTSRRRVPRSPDQQADTARAILDSLAALQSDEQEFLLGVARGVIASRGAVERSIAAVGADEAARIAIRALPGAWTPHPLDKSVGPFYTTASLSERLHITRQAINKRIGRSLIAVRMDDGDYLYPSFQFTESGQVIPGLVEAMGILEAGLPDVWSRAQWVTTAVASLGDRSVVQVLRSGEVNARGRVLRWVTAEAARLSA